MESFKESIEEMISTEKVMTPAEHWAKVQELIVSIQNDAKDLQDMIQDFKRDPFGFGMINPRV